MSTKVVTIRVQKAGGRLKTVSVYDDEGTLIIADVPKEKLISGLTIQVNLSSKNLVISATGNTCCGKSWVIPIEILDEGEIATVKYEEQNSASIWRHLTNPVIYNNFYGCTTPYIIEYPFAYQYYDEILQNVKDYTKAYRYLPNDDGVFNDNRRIAIDNEWFNKAVLYNDQQSTGVLELVAKPMNNLKEYLKYPIYNAESKTITYTKSDNFYQYNTFWGLVKDKSLPLFTKSCESMSIDKIINQLNMDYGKRSFKKEPLRAKDLKVRHILDNKNDIHLVSQFIYTPAQISYK